MTSVSQTLRRMAKDQPREPLPETPIPSVEEVGVLSLQAFGASRLILDVESSVLGETILFTGNRVRLPEDETRVAYTARELENLLGLPRESVLLVHEIKKSFRGSRVVMSVMH